MSERPIEMTVDDARRLRVLLAHEESRPGADRAALERLRHELDRSRLVPSGRVGPRVVTMQSRVVLRDLDTGEQSTYVLVYPEHADHEAGRVSVLAPVGMAILGYREGDVVEWEVPAGWRRLEIRKLLYQPEAAGHEHMKYSVDRMDHEFRLPEATPATGMERPRASHGESLTRLRELGGAP